MADQYFITSRYGIIKEVNYYEYAFSNRLMKNANKKEKFVSFLTISKKYLVKSISPNGFFSLSLMNEQNMQYSLVQKKKLDLSINTIPIVSKWLNRDIKNQFSAFFTQFRSENCFIQEEIKIGIFKLLKCFNYNIELFEDGRFMIHFVPSSRIVIEEPLSIGLFMKIKSAIGNESKNLFLNVIQRSTNRSRKIYFNQERASIIFKKTIESWQDVYATCNYDVVSKFSSTAYYTLFKASKSKISQSIESLKVPASFLKSNGRYELYDLPFLPVIPKNYNDSNNLIIGNNKLVSKLSATYYSGIYQPVVKNLILPVMIGDKSKEVSYFKNLINNHFNKNGSIVWLDVIHIPFHNSETLPEVVNQANLLQKKNVILAIFISGMLNNDVLFELQKSKWKYQIYNGIIDQYRLSNFAMKCLTKMGGIPALIHNIHESIGTYFIGIDFGHMHQSGNMKSSNFAIVFFDHKGKQVFQYVIKELVINEVIQMENLTEGFKKFHNFIAQMPKMKVIKFIIHRDGRSHATEQETILSCVDNIFGISNVDIVDIIKSGYPIMAFRKDNRYNNPSSGTNWQIIAKKYAILITSDQGTEDVETLNPIIIKHRYGQTDFGNIVKQVYWLTRIYTTNIYFSTRIPATVMKANNIAGTGSKFQQASYKG